MGVFEIILAYSSNAVGLIVRSLMYWKNRNLEKRVKGNPCERVEIVNVKPIGNFGPIVIRVRNRSQLKVRLRNPVFEIRGRRTSPPESYDVPECLHYQEKLLAPNMDHDFHLVFYGLKTHNISPKEVKLIDTGYPYQA